MMIHRFYSTAALVVLLLAAGSVRLASAQSKPFVFGPPLRSNIVFSYKFTERVRTVHESMGQTLDSGARVLTYFVSQKQSQMNDGSWQVEANVDSMQLEYVHAGDTLRFDTQKLVGYNIQVDFNHREILAPSSIVNRVAMIKLTPYGEMLGVTSESFDFLREQVLDSTIDVVTRERVYDVISPEFISATLMPWRSVAPLGRSVNYGDTLRTRFGSVIDRVPVSAMADVVLETSAGKPSLSFTSELTQPTRPLAAFTELLDPVAISGVNGRLNGRLNLDEDGVVLSGWTTMKGTIDGQIAGAPIRTTVWQETFTEMTAMMPLGN